MDNNPLKDLQLPNVEYVPFVRDIGGRLIKGAGVGLLIGVLFFKGRSTRKFCVFYGTGVGLGMSYL
jgi:hypothetical protein